MSDATTIAGTVHPRFERVRDVFASNFTQRHELGAACSITLEGETVVDLWGGARSVGGDAWERDTIVTVFSCTKAATALCAHLLVARGELTLDTKVADLWPAFAQSGKGATTVAQLLTHTAGLPALRAPVPEGGSFDWVTMIELLEAEAPWWEPGMSQGYHMTTFGWLVGEVVRRVSGRSLGTFFAEEIAGPQGLDFWIGLPDAEEHRVSPIHLYKGREGDVPSPFLAAALSDRTSLQSLALFNSGRADPNSRAHRAAELGGHGGVANARGLAGLLAPLANGELLPEAHIASLAQPAAETALDETLLLPTRFSHGFMLNMDNRASYTGDGGSLRMPSTAFGHVGMGGSLTMADPAARLSFGYCTNRHGGGLLLNPRGQSLLDAAYACLA